MIGGSISECVCLCFYSSPSGDPVASKFLVLLCHYPHSIQRIFDPRRIRFISQRSDDCLVGEVEGRFSLVFLLHDAERPGCEILTNFHRAEIFTSPALSERLWARRLLSLSCALGRVREWVAPTEMSSSQTHALVMVIMSRSSSLLTWANVIARKPSLAFYLSC